MSGKAFIFQSDQFAVALHNAETLLERRLLGWSHREIVDTPARINVANVVMDLVTRIPKEVVESFKCEEPPKGSPDVCLKLRTLGPYYGSLYVILLNRWDRAYRPVPDDNRYAA